ncbi:50S ribosomal protein L32 [Lacticigenium naphthae]|uniref:50S ribosomal protein L32 n=1 Tax=Lacticigenium naphthae TaxID=515351 RepID=UPI0004044BBE|nr:50S ribosomal protein L32 [Lacticigenium naphthae]
MAVPARRTSTAKKAKRRGHIKLDMPNMSACPNCGEMKKNHHVCGSCGHYAGKEVVNKEV